MKSTGVTTQWYTGSTPLGGCQNVVIDWPATNAFVQTGTDIKKIPLNDLPEYNTDVPSGIVIPGTFQTLAIDGANMLYSYDTTAGEIVSWDSTIGGPSATQTMERANNPGVPVTAATVFTAGLDGLYANMGPGAAAYLLLARSVSSTQTDEG
jgi:hypothetical protein